MNDSSLVLETGTKELIRALLSDGKEVKIKMQGNSMYPSIKSGDSAVIKPVDLAVLKVGQVVVFENGSCWVAHRLVGIENQQFIAQGDSLFSPDPLLKREQLIGVVKTEKSKLLYVKLRPIPQCFNRLRLMVSRVVSRQTNT